MHKHDLRCWGAPIDRILKRRKVRIDIRVALRRRGPLAPPVAFSVYAEALLGSPSTANRGCDPLVGTAASSTQSNW